MEETTLASTAEKTTSPDDISVDPTFIASDLNDDGVEEKIAIDTSSATATIQIKQTKDGGDLTLADISFLPSVTRGGDSSELHYLRTAHAVLRSVAAKGIWAGVVGDTYSNVYSGFENHWNCVKHHFGF